MSTNDYSGLLAFLSKITTEDGIEEVGLSTASHAGLPTDKFIKIPTTMLHAPSTTLPVPEGNADTNEIQIFNVHMLYVADSSTGVGDWIQYEWQKDSTASPPTYSIQHITPSFKGFNINPQSITDFIYLNNPGLLNGGVLDLSGIEPADRFRTTVHLGIVLNGLVNDEFTIIDPKGAVGGPLSPEDLSKFCSKQAMEMALCLAVACGINYYQTGHHCGTGRVSQIFNRSLDALGVTWNSIGADPKDETKKLDIMHLAVHPVNQRLMMAVFTGPTSQFFTEADDKTKRRGKIISYDSMRPMPLVNSLLRVPRKFTLDEAFRLRATGPPAGVHKVTTTMVALRAMIGLGVPGVLPHQSQLQALVKKENEILPLTWKAHRAITYLVAPLYFFLGQNVNKCPFRQIIQTESSYSMVQGEIAYAAQKLLVGSTLSDASVIGALANTCNDTTWQRIVTEIRRLIITETPNDAIKSLMMVCGQSVGDFGSTIHKLVTDDDIAPDKEKMAFISALNGAYHKYLVSREVVTVPMSRTLADDATFMSKVEAFTGWAELLAKATHAAT